LKPYFFGILIAKIYHQINLFLAEQYGLIINIGTWTLQQSCIAAVNWQSLNYEPQSSASVNDPVLQLYDEISSLSII
jgi:EAL domain-containing protein (putative c-di-GMP-specific phosphodiesterase class I)